MRFIKYCFALGVKKQDSWADLYRRVQIKSSTFLQIRKSPHRAEVRSGWRGQATGLIKNALAFLTLRASRQSRSLQVAQSQLVEPKGSNQILCFPADTKKPAHSAGFFVSGGERGIRTLDTLLTYTHFPGVRLQPLSHLSGIALRFIAERAYSRESGGMNQELVQKKARNA